MREIRDHRGGLSWVAALLLLWCSSSPGVAQDQIPVQMDVPLAPAVIPTSDGPRLLYELRLMNFRSVPIDVLAVEVLAEDGRQLMRKAGPALHRDMVYPGRGGSDGEGVIDGGSFVVIMMEVRLEEMAQLPDAVTHRIEARTERDSATRTMVGEPVRVSPEVVRLSPPLRGSNWAAFNGFSNDSDHRRTIIPLDGSARMAQRYAIDWVQFGVDGRLTRGDPSQNENWIRYGAEVLAVSEATVVSVQDGIPENEPLTGQMVVPITLETIGGNYVMLDLGGGRFALYGHLKPGSLRVRVGDRVAAGDVVGLLGNSGNSDGPHLHFHVVDRASPLAAEGLPFVFDRFTLLAIEDDLEQYLIGDPWEPGANPTVRRAEMPLDGAVVTFGEGASLRRIEARLPEAVGPVAHSARSVSSGSVRAAVSAGSAEAAAAASASTALTPKIVMGSQGRTP